MAKNGTKPKRAARRRRRWPWFLARWTVVGASWSTLAAVCLVGWLAYDLPDTGRLYATQRQPSVTVLAADGSVIATFGDLYGNTVRVADLPPYLVEALLATEDRRFYSHFGLDPQGLLRAAYVNLMAWELKQGGSTITQQLAKNVFLSPARTVRRKGQEMLLALWLERKFSKDEILALYLNRVYFGAGAYGVDAAARKFFGKPATQVTPFEAAMLAGLLRAPSNFNPVNDRKAAEGRAQLVLRNMVDAGFLDDEQAKSIATGAASFSRQVADGRSGRHFADWVVDQVSGFVGFVDRDLVVLTTLDPRLQRLAEAELVRVLEAEGEARRIDQAALVTMAPDGAIRAMVGGRDYGTSQFNRATQGLRQPGSAFKPFVFLAGLERGLTPDSLLVDGKLSIDGWQPANYENRYYGKVTLRDAFARSLNSVAVRVSENAGRKRVVEAARRLGITSELTAGPSIALGTSGVSLLELTAAYAVFDNGGNGVWPWAVAEIRDKDNKLLYRHASDGPGQVIESGEVAAMLDLLQAVIDHGKGTGRAARVDRPAAGKTGTGQEYRDAWFVGFTAELVTGVWVGNDDYSPMDKVTGGSVPAQLWHGFMTAALDGMPVRPLPIPEAPAEVAMVLEAPAVTEDREESETADSFDEWVERMTSKRGTSK